MANQETIERVLRLPVWAVVGLTTAASRPAYGVAEFAQRHGKQIVPVNPLGEPVHGQTGYRTLDGLDVVMDRCPAIE